MLLGCFGLLQALLRYSYWFLRYFDCRAVCPSKFFFFYPVFIFFIVFTQQCHFLPKHPITVEEGETNFILYFYIEWTTMQSKHCWSLKIHVCKITLKRIIVFTMGLAKCFASKAPTCGLRKTKWQTSPFIRYLFNDSRFVNF